MRKKTKKRKRKGLEEEGQSSSDKMEDKMEEGYDGMLNSIRNKAKEDYLNNRGGFFS